MRELLKSNDAVLLSYVNTLLTQAELESIIADQNISLVEGSIGIFPRRVLVREADWDHARRVLIDAGLERELLSD
jgi:Putative prokaryotic signal transducing protein